MYRTAQAVSLQATLARIALALSRANKPATRTGRGERTVFTLHRAVGRSRYMPHQGEREMARRAARA